MLARRWWLSPLLLAVAALLLAPATPTAAKRPIDATPFVFIPYSGGSSHLFVLQAICTEVAARGHPTALVVPDYQLADVARLPLHPTTLVIPFKSHPVSPEDGRRMLKEAAAFMADVGGLQGVTRLLDQMEASCEALLADSAALARLRQFVSASTASSPQGASPELESEPQVTALGVTDWAMPCMHLALQAAGVQQRVEVLCSALIEPAFSSRWGVASNPAAIPVFGANQSPASLQSLQGRLVNTIAWHAAILFNRHFVSKFEKQRLRHGAPAAAPPPLLVLANADWALEVPRPLPPLVQVVGPVLSGPAQPLPAHLEQLLEEAGPKGVVLASFGSGDCPQDAGGTSVLLGVAAALSALNRTVLWRLTAGELPEGMAFADFRLPPNVHVAPWLPQNDLLGHPRLVAALLHGGGNGLMQAAWHGVPSVVLPIIEEQGDIAVRAEAAGAATLVERLSLSESSYAHLTAALEQAASDPARRAAAARVSRLMRSHPRLPVERAADWLQHAVAMAEAAEAASAERGKSSSSLGACGSLADPAAGLPWYVRYNVDVYSILAAVLLAALAICGRTLQAALRLAAAALRAAGLAGGKQQPWSKKQA